jgi:hypothetical protein
MGVLATIACAPLASAEPSSDAFFVIGPYAVGVPVGYFVLVRRGPEVGAFRITQAKVGESWDLGSSSYESYFQGDGTGALVAPKVVMRTGEIDIRPMKGVHAFAWQPGKNRLWVGKWWFGCRGNQSVNMASKFSELDDGFEFAPTSAKSIAEVDTTDKALKWFRFDPNTSVQVPVSGLAK